MEIKLYEPWMKYQVYKMFCEQYGRSEEEVAYTMEQFYEHPFQKEKCIRLVALDGDKVVGFQSLFYWPYYKNGKVYNSFQSGNSLVHPDYRGKGIFQNLLRYLDDYNKKLNIDFLIGFPVEMSYKSFIKCKWDNPLNLVWYVSIVNPFAFLFNFKKIKKIFNDKEDITINQKLYEGAYRLHRDEAFKNWFLSSRDKSVYFYFHYIEGQSSVQFSLKLHHRNRWIHELIIGDIQTNTDDPKILKKAFQKLRRIALFSLRVTLISIAINEHASLNLKEVLLKSGFFKTKKSIYFITRNYSEETDINKAENWILYRSDLDTW